MTLKQFFQLAGGCLISLLIYSTALHPILKWPLIIFFVAFGAALAFLPFQERPLEKWVVAFFRSIYSPTIYTWRPYAVAPAFFQTETTQDMSSSVSGSASTSTASSANNSKLPFLSNLEEAENNFLNKVGVLFVATPTIVPVIPPAANVMQTTPQPSVMPISTIPNNFPSATTVGSVNPSIRPEVIVPQIQPLQIPQAPKPHYILSEEKQNIGPANPISMFSTGSAQQVFSANVEANTATVSRAQFSVDAAPPSLPENPNLIVGQVMDKDGKIIEGAILEIKDEAQRPVRALKSNKAGHFMIVTPLLNGRYEIEIDKEGYEFSPLSFEAKGEIIPAIAIQAKNSLVIN